MTETTKRQRQAIGKRIQDEGDCHIRISGRLLARLMSDAGCGDAYLREAARWDGLPRQIDAVVLEGLLNLAGERLPL